MLNLDDLTVESFATAADAAVIGDHETGCIGPCENQFTAGFC
jgi:hypothetical protein